MVKPVESSLGGHLPYLHVLDVTRWRWTDAITPYRSVYEDEDENEAYVTNASPRSSKLGIFCICSVGGLFIVLGYLGFYGFKVG
jgi:hypothetical protein